MSASSKSIGSDLAKVDAHEITAEEYAEIPELDDAFFDKAVRHEGGPPQMRGRPPLGDRAKRSVTIRLDPDVIDHFKALGAGWQTRVNAELRKVIERKTS